MGTNHDYVDLGLPSGTLWATENIKDNDGNELYFAWGETQGYMFGQVGTDKYFACEGENADYNYGSYNGRDTENYGMTKYNNTDGKTVIDMADDAAIANWGEEWRMPTKADFEELTANTEYEWTEIDGVQGGKFTSKVDGYTDKFLFFPAVGGAGYGKVYDVGGYGGCWSVSLDDGDVISAWKLYFLVGGCGVDYKYRYYGYSVRPVHK